MAAMMGQPKPFASLSSGLLARKGQARPAMRPQGFAGFGPFTADADDLGWNDMGHTEPQIAEPSVEVLPTAVATPVAAVAPVPPVLMDRAVLAQEFAAEPVEDATPEPAPVVEQLASARKRRAAARATVPPIKTDTARAKAAFTLRLDEQRHLRLRLASALSRRSAQQLVTEALDAMLASMPEVETALERLSGGLEANG